MLLGESFMQKYAISTPSERNLNVSLVGHAAELPGHAPGSGTDLFLFLLYRRRIFNQIDDFFQKVWVNDLSGRIVHEVFFEVLNGLQKAYASDSGHDLERIK